MGVAGLIFEPHPPNFENLYIFERGSNDVKGFFDISTGFRFSKNSVGRVLSIPLAVLGSGYSHTLWRRSFVLFSAANHVLLSAVWSVAVIPPVKVCMSIHNSSEFSFCFLGI